MSALPCLRTLVCRDMRVTDYSCTAWYKFFLSSTLKSIQGLRQAHKNKCRLLSGSLFIHSEKNGTLWYRSFYSVIQDKFWKVGAKEFASKNLKVTRGNLSLTLRRMYYSFQEKEMLSKEKKRQRQGRRDRRQILKRWFQSLFEANPSLVLLITMGEVVCICLC